MKWLNKCCVDTGTARAVSSSFDSVFSFMGWSFLLGMGLRDFHSFTGLDQPANHQKEVA